MTKNPGSALGNEIKCPSFTMCPLCYGCRAYRTDLDECIECAEDVKNNICNRSLHRVDLISKMILKSEIKITDKDVSFKSE